MKNRCMQKLGQHLTRFLFLLLVAVSCCWSVVEVEAFLTAGEQIGGATPFVPRSSSRSNVPGIQRLLHRSHNGQEDFLSLLVNDLEDPLSNSVEEGLNGMIHATFDFAPLFNPSTAIIRFSFLCGRVLLMTSELLPGHSVTPEEIIIQVMLLLITLNAFYKSAAPMAVSALAPAQIEYRDRYAFLSLFRPHGVTWSQYKMLKHGTLDWITVEPGAMITTDNNLSVSSSSRDRNNTNLEEMKDGDHCNYSYWLYKGNMEFLCQEKSIYKVSHCSQKLSKGPLGMRLVDEMCLVHAIMRENGRQEMAGSFACPPDPDSSNTCDVQAGSEGAVLLRISTTSLAHFIQHDRELEESMMRLAFSNMGDKLSTLQNEQIGSWRSL